MTMAEKLTPQQREAVTNRGGNLLVCAAAGSGKTKVLVDRLLSYLKDGQAPANLDDFLVITYTKAAASELRGKIARALTELMAVQPENRHLQQQMQRLYLAKISTVHGFCGDLLKEYAYMLDIPGDFRVADENECAQLRMNCIQRLLEDMYSQEPENSDFYAFVDTQGLGRDDRLVPEILLKVYDSARCHLLPERWLDACVENALVDELTDGAQTVWGKYLLEDLRGYLALQIGAMKDCVNAALAAEGMEKPAQVLQSIVEQLVCLSQSETWDQVIARKNIDYGRLTFSKKCDGILAERIKSVRSACKKGLEKKLKAFSDNSETVLQDLQDSLPALRGLVALVKRFSGEYDRAKRVRRILDFSDLEQYTLDLLLGRQRSGLTAIAKEVSQRFREIMVDEYQDSNAVQDAIFTALTQERQNCFMVGDVKQSIYQFRLADPGIFLDKQTRFSPVEEAKPGHGRKLQLTSNFRSGGGVLAGVNHVFEACMSPAVGGLIYDETQALVEGLPHEPLGEPEVEFWGIDVQENTYPEEAAFVASRVQELLDGTHFVRDKDGLRPIAPEDIAILLRSPGSSGHYYTAALGSLGIPVNTGTGRDLLQAEEIIALRSLLQTVSNPRQDIPLLATLASPIFGFTADDLASFRAGNRNCSMYDALLQSSMAKAKAFLERLSSLRNSASVKSLSQLLEEIFAQTRLDSIYAAMPMGEEKRENLLQFYRLAAGFESGGHRDLEQFLYYLDSVAESGLLSSGEQNAKGAVTLMSIHKSKGLEFPVVIVAGLSREFNRESIRNHVLCHQELGIGMCAVDTKNRIRYGNIAKKAIAAKMTSESLSEEMRVLYVALTRARDRLIMTYGAKKLEEDVSHIANRMDMGDRQLVSMDAVCPGDWVLMAALTRMEAGALFAMGGRPAETCLKEPVWRIETAVVPETDGTCEKAIRLAEELPQQSVNEIGKILGYTYPHMAATLAPSKQTATQRKGREKDAEAAEFAPQPFAATWRKPMQRGKNRSATDYGNAVHTVLQYISTTRCQTENAVSGEISRMVSQRLLTQEQADMVDCGRIARFFCTDLGKRICAGAQTVREFKFSILDRAGHYGQNLQGEEILLQGVVDLAVIEPEGITVVDFKTDRVTEECLPQRIEQYRPQVQAYAHALSRIYGIPVKEARLYFFHMERYVML